MKRDSNVDPKVYLSGPMRGIPEFNYPKFNEVAQWLREHNNKVVNPAETDPKECDAGDPPSFFRRDLLDLVKLSEHPNPKIVLLPGWERSEGATVEVAVAQVLNIPLFLYRETEDTQYLSELRWRHEPWSPPWKEPEFADCAETLAAEAHYLVNGPRGGSYGPPINDFGKTALIMNSLLNHKLRAPLQPEDVALFMVAVKLSREAHKHKRDNLVDAIGYLITLQSCLDSRKRIQEQCTSPNSSVDESSKPLSESSEGSSPKSGPTAGSQDPKPGTAEKSTSSSPSSA